MKMEVISMEMKTEVIKMKTDDSPLRLATSRPVEGRRGEEDCDQLPLQEGFPANRQ